MLRQRRNILHPSLKRTFYDSFCTVKHTFQHLHSSSNSKSGKLGTSSQAAGEPTQTQVIESQNFT
jgi:hypothetical protein